MLQKNKKIKHLLTFEIHFILHFTERILVIPAQKEAFAEFIFISFHFICNLGAKLKKINPAIIYATIINSRNNLCP